jgi:hypothetical protein
MVGKNASHAVHEGIMSSAGEMLRLREDVTDTGAHDPAEEEEEKARDGAQASEATEEGAHRERLLEGASHSSAAEEALRLSEVGASRRRSWDEDEDADEEMSS